MSMTPEQIAALDQQLKKNENGILLASLDRLFFNEEDRAAIVKLKPAAKDINRAKEWMEGEQKDLWEKALKEQFRYSVDKAKDMTGKN